VVVPNLDLDCDEIGASTWEEVVPGVRAQESHMTVFLAKLTQSRNQLAHRVHDHIVELGLSVDELLLMWTILEDEWYTAAVVRHRLGMRQSTFTSMVARLVRRGYLKTEPCLRDHRTRYLRLTLPGFKATMIARSIHREIEAMAQPYDRLAIDGGLDRLALLTSLIPRPELMEDGLPTVTA
jgi:DNA-binding MarR family transcriptional regulator